MSKIIFFFAGTGDDGSDYEYMKENKYRYQDDVIRVYIGGCQEKRVGNGFLFPDLEIAANNVRNAFEGNVLDLDKLEEHFGDGLYAIHGAGEDVGQVKVDDITLDGFSRGAVTAFAVVKKLDDLDVPIHILANQPVPGESGIVKSLYSRYCDLRDCRNIKSAHTFLASYDLEQGFIHNYFFRQMVAKFAPAVNAQQILFPHQHHLDWVVESPIHNHLNKIMAENGLTHSNNDVSAIQGWYQRNTSNYFTPHEFMQTVYGAEGVLKKDPIYLDMQVRRAQALLVRKNTEFQGVLTPDQATAINAINNLPNEDIDDQTKRKLYELVLKDSKRAEQFTKIVNKVTEVCDYLPRVTVDSTSNKSALIHRHAGGYKKSVFLDSFEFLSKGNPSEQDKKQFAGNIYKAECAFREQALGIDRNVMRMIMKVLANFITHITGVALIVNTINKVKTGNWLLFEHNRSENAVRDTRRAILNDVDKLSSEASQGDIAEHGSTKSTRQNNSEPEWVSSRSGPNW